MATHLTPFQRAKFTYLFERFYDTNKNGIITNSDFVEMLQALQHLRGWTAGDPRLKQCEQALNKAWQALKRSADVNQDQKVSMDEWYIYWTGFLAASQNAANGWPEAENWVKDYMNLWFDLMDTSGDGFVDEIEFATICTHFGVPAADSKTAFHKFGVKPVDRKYFSELWLQYMTSDDQSQPGNFIFGRVDW